MTQYFVTKVFLGGERLQAARHLKTFTHRGGSAAPVCKEIFVTKYSTSLRND